MKKWQIEAIDILMIGLAFITYNTIKINDFNFELQWPPLVGKVRANIMRVKRVLRGQRNKFPRPLISVF
jgi:hypothetical protein